MADAEHVDVFISYTTGDWAWARWLDFILREAGYATKVQGYDFTIGKSFIHAMDEALRHCRLLACLLSPAYLASTWCNEEWKAGLYKDKLLLLRIAECEPDGLLGPRAYLDLVGVPEDQARDQLLAALKQRDGNNPRPKAKPAFPGTASPSSPRPRFPNTLQTLRDKEKRNQPDGSSDSRADILLVTATRIETAAVLNAFGASPEVSARTIENRVYFDLGTGNGKRVMMTQSEMGSGGLGASQDTTQQGITALAPESVIMVGIAFGISEERQAIGDILVSEQIRLYELQRVGTDGNIRRIILRGDKPHASSKLINLLRSSELAWTGAKVRFGTVLTGEKLVDNLDFRDQLRDFEPEAIGGEMEGAGLYVACQARKVDWIMVKGICDFADGQKSKDKSERQGLAARHAAAFVRHGLAFAPVDGTHAPPMPRSRNTAKAVKNNEAIAVDSKVETPEAHFASAQSASTKSIPLYRDAENRVLAKKLETAYLRKRSLQDVGADIAEIQREIVDTKRSMRDGGRLKPGDVLGDGRFVLLDSIGTGGFATVWKARDTTCHRDVAVKVMHGNLAGSTLQLDRFRRGARIMGSLNHPAVARIVEPYSEDLDWHYFVMELLSGGDLERAVHDGKVKYEQVVPLMIPICDAVAYAHARQVIHRDLKPANVLLGEHGQPKLTDFDLVALPETFGGTRTGVFLGTPSFAAPEVLDGFSEPRFTADVYSLAKVATFCFYGAKLPRAAEKDMRVFIGQLKCPKSVRDVLTRATEDDPLARFPHAGELRDALRATLENHCVQETKGASSCAFKPTVGSSRVVGAQPIETDLRRTGDTDELRRIARDELLNLRNEVSFDSASLQIFLGDVRELFLAFGFSEDVLDEELMLPISVDPLVRSIVQSRQPLFLTSTCDVSHWGQPDVQSWIGAPILAGDKPIGLLTLDFRDSNLHLEALRGTIERFVTRLVPVIERAVSVSRLLSSEAILSVVHGMLHAIGQNLDPDATLKYVVSAVVERLKCRKCMIFFPQQRAGEVLLVMTHTSPPNKSMTRTFGSGNGIVGWTFDHGCTVVLSDAGNDPRYAPSRGRTTGNCSLLVVPIKLNDRTIGVICADQDSFDWFHEDDVRLVEVLAQQTAIAIGRSTPFQMLQRFTAGYLDHNDLAAILLKVVDGAVSACQATTGVVYLLTGDKLNVRESAQPATGHTFPAPRLNFPSGVTRTIVEQCAPVKIVDMVVDSRVNPRLLLMFKSLVGLPLMVHGETIGVLYIFSEVLREFSELEMSLLATLTNVAATAVRVALMKMEGIEEELDLER